MSFATQLVRPFVSKCATQPLMLASSVLKATSFARSIQHIKHCPIQGVVQGRFFSTFSTNEIPVIQNRAIAPVKEKSTETAPPSKSTFDVDAWLSHEKEFLNNSLQKGQMTQDSYDRFLRDVSEMAENYRKTGKL